MRSAAKPLIVIVLCAALAAFLYSRYRSHTPSPAADVTKADNPATPESSPSSTAAASRAGAPPASPATQGGSPPPAATSGGAPPPFANTAPRPPATPYLLGSAEASPPMEPAILLNNMRNVIANYGSRYGGNPVGDNAEITAALNGDNPNGAKFIAEDSGLRINGRGELVDYWGTPFFFHQVSGREMEIRSAGPDRKMWTADDLVTK